MDNQVSLENLRVRYIQSICRYSAPLESYSNEFDRIMEQKLEVIKVQMDIQNKLQAKMDHSNMRSYFFSIMMCKTVLKELLKKDIVWAAGAVIFVVSYMSLHMKSFFLAIFSVALIGFSFAITHLIYFWILGIYYFQALHLMTVFLVLGIAADDIFVFHDAWV